MRMRVEGNPLPCPGFDLTCPLPSQYLAERLMPPSSRRSARIAGNGPGRLPERNRRRYRSRAASQPASQPTSQPTSQPASQQAPPSRRAPAADPTRPARSHAREAATAPGDVRPPAATVRSGRTPTPRSVGSIPPVRPYHGVRSPHGRWAARCVRREAADGICPGRWWVTMGPRGRLQRWYARWRVDAGTQGRIIRSQGERWRAMGGQPPQVVAATAPRLHQPL